jgi:murein DD-endopeptidase MepM/ murein hydrolase activator NlpD
LLGQDNRPGLAPQLWFALIMAAIVVGLLVARQLELDDSAVREVVHQQIERLQASAADREAAAAAPVDAETPDPEAAAVDIPVATPTAEWLSPTPRPTVTRRPPDEARRDHYWLERPIAPPGNASVARFYPYGSRMDGSYPIHHGVEMINPAGTPVLAPASGVVIVAGDDSAQVYGARPGFYGLLVVLQLDQRYQGMPVYVLMAHLSEVQVSVGQHVSGGQVLGLVGETGYAEAPHLHTEVRLGRNDYMSTVNPELWYRPLEGRGTLAGLLMTRDGEPVHTEAKLVLRRDGQYLYEVFTYPAEQVNSDPEWGENFGIGDLQPGNWTVEVFYRGVLYTSEFQITAGRTTWLVMEVG